MYKNYTIKFGVPSAHVRKVLLIMRLTTFLLFIMFFRVSATGYAQQISLNEKKVILKVVISKIQQQSNFDFVYTAQQLKNTGKVSISIKSADIKTVLDLVLKDQPLAYTIDDNTIVLKDKTITTAAVNFIDVNGSVSNGQGAGLPGATIRLRGTQIQVATDQAGSYKLLRVPDDGHLVFSYIGYQSDTIAIKGRTKIDVILK